MRVVFVITALLTPCVEEFLLVRMLHCGELLCVGHILVSHRYCQVSDALFAQAPFSRRLQKRPRLSLETGLRLTVVLLQALDLRFVAGSLLLGVNRLLFSL